MAFFSRLQINFFHLYYCCWCLSKNHVFSCSMFASWSCYCICISNLLLHCVRACNKLLEKWQVISTLNYFQILYFFSPVPFVCCCCVLVATKIMK
jgi:hypothetical protein